MSAKASSLEVLKKCMLHAIMGKGIVSKSGIIYLFNKFMSDHAKDSYTRTKCTLKDLIHSINDDMRKYGFEIRTVRSEVDGKLYYCFVNKKDDMAAKFSKPARDDWQMAVFRVLFTKIINSETGTSTLAHLYASKSEVDCLKSLKPSDLDGEVTVLVKQGWLAAANESCLTLGPRAMAELTEDLREKTSLCAFCKQPVVLGLPLDDDKMQHEPCKNGIAEKADEAFTFADVEATRRDLLPLIVSGEKEWQAAMVATAQSFVPAKRRRRAAGDEPAASPKDKETPTAARSTRPRLSAAITDDSDDDDAGRLPKL